MIAIVGDITGGSYLEIARLIATNSSCSIIEWPPRKQEESFLTGLELRLSLDDLAILKIDLARSENEWIAWVKELARRWNAAIRNLREIHLKIPESVKITGRKFNWRQMPRWSSMRWKSIT